MPELRYLALASVLALAAACQANVQRPAASAPSVVVEPEEDWRGIARPEHASISEDLPPLFVRLAGAARRSAADRDLLDPGRLLAAPTPAPGAYRCRLVRLPATAAPVARRGRAAARPAFCFVGAEGERLSLTLETPARRLGGFLWPTGNGRRMVFLGAGFVAPVRTAPAYSEAAAGNAAGLFERIGDFRYRLAVRGPSAGTVDVYELVAAPSEL